MTRIEQAGKDGEGSRSREEEKLHPGNQLIGFEEMPEEGYPSSMQKYLREWPEQKTTTHIELDKPKEQ